MEEEATEEDALWEGSFGAENMCNDGAVLYRTEWGQKMSEGERENGLKVLQERCKLGSENT